MLFEELKINCFIYLFIYLNMFIQGTYVFDLKR